LRQRDRTEDALQTFEGMIGSCGTSSKTFTHIITHRHSIGDFREAFELIESAQSGKVLLSWESRSAL
jgi:threonine dehydrogenase-like Zn-dependent dehydrogenase